MLEKVKKLFKPIDLTSGNPLKIIILFSLPILLSNLFQQVYLLADAIIVGQVIPLQFAGISNTGPLNFLVLQFAFGCTSGFSIVISNRFGKKDLEGTKKAFISTIYLSLMVSVVLTILALSTSKYMLYGLGIKEELDPVTYRAAYIYINVMFAGMISQILYNLVVSVNRSIGDSVTPLLFLILSSILNILLDLLFVNVMPNTDLQVFGVAFATVLAQFISFILCLIFTLKKYKFLRFTFKEFVPEKSDLLEQLKLGLPLGFQFSVIAIGMIVVQSSIVKFDKGIFIEGTNINAHYAQDGFAAANKLSSLLIAPYSALGVGVLSYAAQNYGSNNNERVIEGFKKSMMIAFCLYLIDSTIGLLLSINGAFVYIFLNESQIYKETIEYAITYNHIVLPCAFFLVTIMVSRSFIQGLGKSLVPFISSFLELVVRISLCLIATEVMGKNGLDMSSFMLVCGADACSWLTGAIVLTSPLIYYLKKLKNHIDIDRKKVKANN